MTIANGKTTYIGGAYFEAYEETDPLGDVRVRIWSRLWQSCSGWYAPNQVDLAWKEAEAKLPFEFVWTPVEISSRPGDTGG